MWRKCEGCEGECDWKCWWWCIPLLEAKGFWLFILELFRLLDATRKTTCEHRNILQDPSSHEVWVLVGSTESGQKNLAWLARSDTLNDDFVGLFVFGVGAFLKLSKSQAYFNHRSAESYPPSPRVFTSPSLCLHLQRVQKRRKATIELVHENLPKTCLTFTPATMRKPRNFPERTDPLKVVESTKQSDMSSQWPFQRSQHRGPWLTALHRQATADRSKPKFLGQSWWLWVKIGDVDAEPMGSTHLGIWPSHGIVRFGSHFGMGPGTRALTHTHQWSQHAAMRNCDRKDQIGPVGFWRSRSTAQRFRPNSKISEMFQRFNGSKLFFC